MILNNKRYNIGTTGGRWKPYSITLRRGVYNTKFYEEGSAFYGTFTGSSELGEVKFKITKPAVLSFIRDTWSSSSGSVYGAIDNVSIN